MFRLCINRIDPYAKITLMDLTTGTIQIYTICKKIGLVTSIHQWRVVQEKLEMFNQSIDNAAFDIPLHQVEQVEKM